MNYNRGLERKNYLDTLNFGAIVLASLDNKWGILVVRFVSIFV
jgi:hypothetical protein